MYYIVYTRLWKSRIETPTLCLGFGVKLCTKHHCKTELFLTNSICYMFLLQTS